MTKVSIFSPFFFLSLYNSLPQVISSNILLGFINVPKLFCFLKFTSSISRFFGNLSIIQSNISTTNILFISKLNNFNQQFDQSPPTYSFMAHLSGSSSSVEIEKNLTFIFILLRVYAVCALKKERY